MPFFNRYRRHVGNAPYRGLRRTTKTYAGVNRRFGKFQSSNTLSLRRPLTSYNTMTPWSPATYRDMKYTQNILLSVGVAGLTGAEQVFRLNSLFDPDLSGVGHQPYGFDQVAAFYKHYRVEKATIEVTVYNATTNRMFLFWTVANPDNTKVLTEISPDFIGEMPNADYVICSPDSGQAQTNIRRTFDMAEMAGLTSEQYRTKTDLDYSANVGGSPTRPIVIRFATASGDLTDPQSIKIYIKITYRTRFWGLLTLGPS